MKIKFSSFIITIVTLFLAITAISQERITAFVNVNVIPMDRDEIYQEQTVIIKGEQIKTIGSTREAHFLGSCSYFQSVDSQIMKCFGKQW